jgi:sugar lactone lactonase YvrE
MGNDMKTRYGKISSGVLAAIVIALAVIGGITAVLTLDVTGKKGNRLGDEFVYDLKGKGIFDPKLLIYEESSLTIETGLADARAIAIGIDANIYVAGDEAVKIFGGDGKLLSEIKVGGQARCVAVDGEGKMYVGLKDRVEVYQGSERIAQWAELGSDAVITSIAIDRDDVFVADAGRRLVVRYDMQGNIKNLIGQKDAERDLPGFVIPSAYFDIAVASDGLLRVVDPGRHKMLAFTFDGDLEFSWGKASIGIEGFCGCCNPVNFAIDSEGNFITAEKGLIRVKVYDPEGQFVGVVAGCEQLSPGKTCNACAIPADCQDGGFDVAVSKDGKVYILDAIKRNVRVFTKTGQ